MGKSRKKTPIEGHTTAVSEKQDKRLANRANRRINKIIASTATEETVFEDLRETSNVCCFDKDGKGYFGDIADQELLKKNLRK